MPICEPYCALLTALKKSARHMRQSSADQTISSIGSRHYSRWEICRGTAKKPADERQTQDDTKYSGFRYLGKGWGSERTEGARGERFPSPPHRTTDALTSSIRAYKFESINADS
jgi:hypothetical protein